MKKKQSAQVPVSKVQNYLSKISTILGQTSDQLHVTCSTDGVTSIRLARGKYLTISFQEGGQS